MDEARLRQIVREEITALEKDLKLRVKFTNDEYGEAAKELGLIKYSYPGDGGIDLPIVLSKEQRNGPGITIFPGDRILLHTGMIMEFPEGYCARIIHRSSTEKTHRLRVIEGLIDDYRGEILVQVHNMNSYPIVFQHGERAAQIILFKACSMTIEEADTLRPSKRGSKGFGSSGR